MASDSLKGADAGCVAFSQANAPIADTQVLWRALQYAATFGYPVWLRAEDVWLAKGGVAHDGEVATRLGLPGIPPFAETIALGTILELVRATGARVHLCRLSTAGAVELVRRAKAERLPVTCDVSIHHVHLCDVDLGYYLFRGGMKPHGLGKERDEVLNAALEAALQPIADAAQALGAPREDARLLVVETFAHATGLLLLAHTGRIRMFGASAPNLMERYVESNIRTLTGGRGREPRS